MGQVSAHGWAPRELLDDLIAWDGIRTRYTYVGGPVWHVRLTCSTRDGVREVELPRFVLEHPERDYPSPGVVVRQILSDPARQHWRDLLAYVVGEAWESYLRADPVRADGVVDRAEYWFDRVKRASQHRLPRGWRLTLERGVPGDRVPWSVWMTNGSGTVVPVPGFPEGGHLGFDDQEALDLLRFIAQCLEWAQHLKSDPDQP